MAHSAQEHGLGPTGRFGSVLGHRKRLRALFHQILQVIAVFRQLRFGTLALGDVFNDPPDHLAAIDVGHDGAADFDRVTRAILSDVFLFVGPELPYTIELFDLRDFLFRILLGRDLPKAQLKKFFAGISGGLQNRPVDFQKFSGGVIDHRHANRRIFKQHPELLLGTGMHLCFAGIAV